MSSHHHRRRRDRVPGGRKAEKVAVLARLDREIDASVEAVSDDDEEMIARPVQPSLPAGEMEDGEIDDSCESEARTSKLPPPPPPPTFAARSSAAFDAGVVPLSPLKRPPSQLQHLVDTSGESLDTARSEPTTTVPERGQTGPLQLPVADYAPCPVTPDSDHDVDELEQQQAHDGDNAKEGNAECLLAADVVAAVSSEQSVVSDAVDDVQTVQDEPTIDAMVSESRQSVNEPLPSEPSWASCDQAPAASAPAVDDLPDDFDAHQLLEAELDRSVDCTAGRPTRPGRGSRRRQFKAAKRARVRVRQGQGAKPVQDDNASPDSKRRRLMRLNKTEYFEVLPDGWKEMEHASGLPIFYHAATCVCTFSRPYFLGGASARHHTVPISAIPCLQQRRARERADEDHEQQMQMQLQQHDVGAAKNDVIADFHEKFGAPAVKVQTAADYRRCTLVPRELRTYCAERFELNVKGPHKAACDKDVELNGDGCDQNEAGAADVAVDDAITTEASCSGTNDATNGVTSMCANVEAEAVAEKSLPDRPAMPSNLQLITVHTSAPAGNERKFRHGRNFCLNPQGKTSVAVLHEFVQKVFRVQIRYEYEETRNPAAPYKARVMLANKSNHGANGYKQPKTQQDIKQIVSKLRERAPNASGSPIKLEPGVESAEDQWTTVGQGTGASKNKAKLEAARNALSVLVPGVQFGADGIATGAAPPPASQATNGAGGASIGNEVPSSAAPTVKAEIGGEAETLALFDLLPVCDGRVSEMSVKLGQPSPFVVLQECLKRNATFGDTTIETRVEHLGHQRHNFHMTVGKHNVSAECKNKLTGKQAAAQAMLQKLHPLLTSWGALLRLYGYDATQKLKETKKKKDEVIQLQTTGTNSRGPNQAILDKLRLEMDRLYKSMAGAPPAPPSPSKRAHAFADV